MSDISVIQIRIMNSLVFDSVAKDMVVAKNEKNQDNVLDEVSSKIPGLGYRHVQILLLFLGMVIGYCLRVCISVAVVSMMNSSTANHQFEVFNWTTSEKSQILSSFFWGYTVMQLPSGYLAGTWSAQKVLSLGMMMCGILNILIPTVAHYGGMIAVCICRVGMGLAQSCLLPCVHTFLSKWAPSSERARLGSFAYAGAQFGTVIALPISGVLAGSNIGWPSIFYVFGALAMCWSILFFIFGFDSPSAHPRISNEEKAYIQNNLTGDQISENPEHKVKLKTPWKAIFTSVPMWALIIVHCGQNWGYWTLLTEMPSYMNAVLKFNIEENGAISALPYLVMWILSFPVSFLSDYALEKGVSRGVARKICNTISHWGPAVALICLGAIPNPDKTIAVAILVVAVGLNAGSLSGFQINHIDLSPNFAGTMMAITNCIASVIAIIAPLICGVIVTGDETDVTQWCIVFYLAAAIYFIGNFVFIVFGQAEVQPWNDGDSTESRKESKMELPDI